MKKFLKLTLDKPELTGIVFLVALTIVFQFRSNGVFLDIENLRGILGLLPEMGLVAIGVTLLMICGEFDLSVGSVFALTPMVMAVMVSNGVPFPPAFFAGLLVAATVGLANGLLTLRFAIPSFITTLGMMFVARSATVVISGGFPPVVPAGSLPTWLFSDYLWPGSLLRVSFLWFALAAILASVLLSDQFRQLDTRDGRLHSGGAGHGHSDRSREDRRSSSARCLQASPARSRCCGSVRRCRRSAKASSCRRWQRP